MNVSLDGFVEGPNGQDWMIADAELHEHGAAQLGSADAILFGRLTDQLFVDYGPTAAPNPASTESVIDFANTINS
jgi:hypothetical protein